MNTFIEKNERFLKCSFAALRISGWVLLVFSLCCPVISIVLLRNSKPRIAEQLSVTMVFVYLTLTFLGLLGIGLAQSIRYLLDSDYKPRFILRHGDKFIYVYVGLTLIAAANQSFHFKASVRFTGYEEQLLSIFLSFTQTVYHVAKAFILIGIAQFVKRVMPIMDEHKALV